ncbi:MAG TPA: phage tail tape measure protein [Chitinispirillaceae bacterium]|nr:phage tail tape measure protein [Chitinispirillaceae bacterium]
MANRTENLKLIISGDGRLLGAELGRSERQIRNWGGRVDSVFSGIGKKLISIAKSPLAIAGGAAGILYAGKQIIDYNSKLTRLGIQAEISTEEILKLKEELGNVALATGQSRTDLLAGLEKIVEQTGDLKFARDIMQDLGIAATATGAGMEYLGALAVQLRDKLKMGKDEIKASLNLLTVQGKAGAFTLENMATMGERLFAAAGRFDMKGIKDLGNFGAMLQIARMGTGSSEQATTAIENMLADILDKQKEIKKAGFNIFAGEGQLKKFDEIVKGIITATKGNEIKLGNIFGRESIRGLTTLAKLYRDTGGFDLFEQLAGADAEKADQIMKDFLQYSTDLGFQLKQIGNLAWDFGEAAFGPALGTLSKSLNELLSDSGKMDAFRNEIRELGSEIGRGASKVYEMVGALEGFLMISKAIAWVIKTPFEVKEWLESNKEWGEWEIEQKARKTGDYPWWHRNAKWRQGNNEPGWSFIDPLPSPEKDNGRWC